MSKLLVIILFSLASISYAAENLSSEKVGAILLTEYSTTNEGTTLAISVTKEFLESEGENPSDFYLQADGITTNQDGELTIPLWYKSAFTQPASPGNPGGLSRNVIYDINNSTILRQEWWQ